MTYVERPPLPGLAEVVRTVWIQRTGEEDGTPRVVATWFHVHGLGTADDSYSRSTRWDFT